MGTVTTTSTATYQTPGQPEPTPRTFTKDTEYTGFSLDGIPVAPGAAAGTSYNVVPTGVGGTWHVTKLRIVNTLPGKVAVHTNGAIAGAFTIGPDDTYEVSCSVASVNPLLQVTITLAEDHDDTDGSIYCEVFGVLV
jgi:hypothetical protein